jgi:hypothetical protein
MLRVFHWQSPTCLGFSSEFVDTLLGCFPFRARTLPPSGAATREQLELKHVLFFFSLAPSLFRTWQSVCRPLALAPRTSIELNPQYARHAAPRRLPVWRAPVENSAAGKRWDERAGVYVLFPLACGPTRDPCITESFSFDGDGYDTTFTQYERPRLDITVPVHMKSCKVR